MEVRSSELIVDMPAEKMPATISAETMDGRPSWRMSGTMKSLSLPGMPGKLAAPVTPHHSMKLAENHMPSVPRRTALNIVP